MSLRGKGCIAPKLRVAKNEGSKTLLSSLHSLPHRVLDSLFFAPRSFGAMQPLPRKLVSEAKITMKIGYSAFSKGNIINFYIFRDLYNLYEY